MLTVKLCWFDHELDSGVGPTQNWTHKQWLLRAWLDKRISSVLSIACTRLGMYALATFLFTHCYFHHAESIHSPISTHNQETKEGASIGIDMQHNRMPWHFLKTKIYTDHLGSRHFHVDCWIHIKWNDEGSLLDNSTWQETYLVNVSTRCSSPPRGDEAKLWNINF